MHFTNFRVITCFKDVDNMLILSVHDEWSVNVYISTGCYLVEEIQKSIMNNRVEVFHTATMVGQHHTMRANYGLKLSFLLLVILDLKYILWSF